MSTTPPSLRRRSIPNLRRIASLETTTRLYDSVKNFGDHPNACASEALYPKPPYDLEFTIKSFGDHHNACAVEMIYPISGVEG